MKIENIIDDIKKDIVALKDKLEEQFRKNNAQLDFSFSLPDIEELTTIKSIVLVIDENNTVYYLGVQIHTHNGNRVFEIPSKKTIGGEATPYQERHPLQDEFIDLLREIIKKNKNKTKAGYKSGDFYGDILQCATALIILYVCLS